MQIGVQRKRKCLVSAAPFSLPEYLASCRLQEEVRLKAVSQWSLD